MYLDRIGSYRNYVIGVFFWDDWCSLLSIGSYWVGSDVELRIETPQILYENKIQKINIVYCI